MSIITKLLYENPLSGDTKRQRHQETSESREARIAKMKTLYPPEEKEQEQIQSPFTMEFTSSQCSSAPIVKEPTDCPLWSNREIEGPLSKVDSDWTNSMDFVKKAILNAEKELDLSSTKLKDAKDSLLNAQTHNQDCHKKVSALTQALIKLQHVVPNDPTPTKAEPELLTEEKKVVRKKAAKKVVKKKVEN